ncbi:MAG: hypothetical protein AAF927_29905 [Bacteroidota bacterium]
MRLGCCILLVLLGHLAWAQSDSLRIDTVGFIEVDKDNRSAEREQQSRDRRNDFYRNMVLWRLPIQHPQNRPLLLAQSPDQQGGAVYAQAVDGLMLNLIEGLRTGNIQARHPDDLRRRYDYFDLIYDLIELQGLDPDTLADGLAVAELGWDNLNQYVDLIVEEGFSAHDSRAFTRIKFMRILWHDPQSPKGQHVLAVLSYAEAAKVLEDLHYSFDKHGQKMRIRLFDFFETQMYYGNKLGMGEDPAFVLPPNRRSPEALKNRWPELWHN